MEKRAAEAEKSNQKRQKEAIGIALEEERKKLDAAAEKQSELLKQIDELNGQRDRQVAEARRKAEEEMNAKFAKERAELEEKERAAKAVADVARKQIDAAKRQAVSYTHLDVYKRQGYESYCNIFWKRSSPRRR